VAVLCGGTQAIFRDGIVRRNTVRKTVPLAHSSAPLERYNLPESVNADDGYLGTDYRLRDTWVATVSALHNPFKRESKLRYDSTDQDKLAAFDVITHRLSRCR